MSNADDRPTPRNEDDAPPEPPLYAVLELEDGVLVLYDAENHRAWLKSNHTASLAACA